MGVPLGMPLPGLLGGHAMMANRSASFVPSPATHAIWHN